MTEEDFLDRKTKPVEPDPNPGVEHPLVIEGPAARELPIPRERPVAREIPAVVEPPAVEAAPGAAPGADAEADATAAPASTDEPTVPAPKTSLTADEQDIRTFWREYGRELVRGSVRGIDAIGRQVLVVDGLLVGLYAHALAFGDLRATPLSNWQVFIYLLPVIFLLFSLLFAGGIFFMDKGTSDLPSLRVARATHSEAVRNKTVFLRTALLLLALAVVAILGALWVYLSGG